MRWLTTGLWIGAAMLSAAGCCFTPVSDEGTTSGGAGTSGTTSGGGTSGGTSGATCSPFGAACPSGQYCNFAISLCDAGGFAYAAAPGTCVTPVATGAPCQSDVDCPAADDCTGGVCQPEELCQCPKAPDAGLPPVCSAPTTLPVSETPHANCTCGGCLIAACPSPAPTTFPCPFANDAGACPADEYCSMIPCVAGQMPRCEPPPAGCAGSVTCDCLLDAGISGPCAMDAGGPVIAVDCG